MSRLGLDALDLLDQREYWDQAAREYPKQLSLLYGKKKEFDWALVNEFAQPQLFREGAKVLDAGSGKGCDAIRFVKRFDCRVHGIDLSAEMTSTARKSSLVECSTSESNRLHFEVGDLRKLPYPDNHFDVTCSFSAIDHIPEAKDRDRAVKELIRVTKKDGTIILTLPNQDSLPSLLKSKSKLLVRPGNFRGTDYVEVSERTPDSGYIEYSFEAPYAWDELRNIAIREGLNIISEQSGVMRDCVEVSSAEEIFEHDTDNDSAFLVNRAHGRAKSTVSSVRKEWIKFNEMRRGLRLGMVARR